MPKRARSKAEELASEEGDNDCGSGCGHNHDEDHETFVASLEVDFDYASTCPGPLFDRLYLPTEVLSVAAGKPGGKDWEQAALGVCDAASFVFESACGLRFSPHDLSKEIRALAVLQQLTGSLEAGSFSQWVYGNKVGSKPEWVEWVKEALELVEATQSAQAFSSAMAVVAAIDDADIKVFEDSNYGEGFQAAMRSTLDAAGAALVALLRAGGTADGGHTQGTTEGKESLLQSLYAYAITVGTSTLAVKLPKKKGDPTELLTPAWWPTSIVECAVTTAPASKQLLSGLRRAAASIGFGFVRMGWADPASSAAQEAQEEAKEEQKKKKAKAVAADAPAVPTLQGVAQLFPGVAAREAPALLHAAFWVVSTVGPLTCQLFDVPESEQEAGEEQRLAVFCAPDGSPVGMASLGEDDEGEGDEGDEGDEEEQGGDIPDAD